MTPSTERKVGGRGAFRYKTKPEIKLLSLLLSLLTLPAAGVKAQGILKVFLVHGRNPRGSEQVMALGDNPVGSVDMHRRFDLSENRVKGRVDSESLADDMAKERAFEDQFLIR